MNCAIGQITEAAETAIKDAGGHIEATLQPDIVMAVMPNATSVNVSGDDDHVYIVFSYCVST